MYRPLIAVVDDDPALRQVVQDLLEDEGYATLLRAQGTGAYELIREAQPALVILDLWLEHPNAGGMVLALLELDEATNHIPVIVCSGYMQLYRDQQTLLRGKGYVLLEKPFSVEALLGHVQALLASARTQEAGEQPERVQPSAGDRSY
jgi:two-component system nitrogen regulation response regulator NtrX